MVTAATAMYRKPFLPGEIIDVELRAPSIGNPDINRIIVLACQREGRRQGQ